MQGYTLAYPVIPFVGSYQGMEKGQGGMAEDSGGWRTALVHPENPGVRSRWECKEGIV